jgi:acyl-CoA synthetase (NDP forming)
MFSPRAITIVGGSPRIGASVRLATSLTESVGDFSGPIRVVNRSRTAVRGVPAVASTDEIAGPLGLTYLMVSPAAAIDWLEKAEDRRDEIDGIVLYAGGFAEVGNDRDQAILAEWARSNDVPILGPQSLGLARAKSSLLGLCATMPANLTFGSAAVLCQSGGITGGSVRALSQRGVGIAAACSYGNGSIVTFIDLARALIAADDVEILGIHTEAIPDLDLLRVLGREADRLGKPLLLTMAGASELGARAVKTHTASVATPRRLAQGACDQAGIIWVEDVDQLVLGIDALHAAGPRSAIKPGIGIFSGSGGGAIAITDALSAAGVAMIDPAPATAERLRSLGIEGEIANPLDCGAAMLDHPDRYADQLTVFAQDPGYGIVCKVIGSSPPTHDAPAQLKQYSDFVETVQKTGRIPFLGTPVAQQVDAVTWPGVPWESGAQRVAAKLRVLDLWARYRQRTPPAPEAAETGQGIQAQILRAGVSPAQLVTGPRVMGMLTEAPVSMPPSMLLTSADDLNVTAGAAVFVKTEAGLDHRWLAGGVIGPLDQPDSVRAAVQLLAARWGFPISVTIAVPHDAEYIVGVERFSDLGIVCSIGRGGIGAGEHLVLYRSPMDMADCRRLVRAGTGLDCDELAELTRWMVRLAEANPSFGSLEFNPVVIDHGRLVALDAKLTVRDETLSEFNAGKELLWNSKSKTGDVSDGCA